MRDIRESQLFGEQCREIGLSIRRLDEVRLGVDWAVHTDAEHLPLVMGTNLRVLRTVPFPDAPELRIFFRIKDDSVVLYEWIELVEEDPDEPVD